MTTDLVEEIIEEIDEEQQHPSPFLDDMTGYTRYARRRVRAMCQKAASDKCRGIVTQPYAAIRNVMDNNSGIYMCIACSHFIKHSGRLNPTCRYRSLDDDFFSSIDTEAKGYLLGWIASDGHLRPDGAIVIKIHEKDEETLLVLRDLVCKELPITRSSNDTSNLVTLRFHSKKMVRDICTLLRINPGKKCTIVNFPQGLSQEISWAFVRGLFDGDGFVRKLGGRKYGHRNCTIGSTSNLMKESLSNFVGEIKWYIDPKCIGFTGDDSLRFLNKIYQTADPRLRLRRKYDLYLEYLDFVPALIGVYGKVSGCRCVKTHVDGILPFGRADEDGGLYDLSLIEVDKIISENVTRYKTGIKIQPEEGWKIEIIAEESLIETGYNIHTDPDTSDHSYRKTLRVNLIKTKPQAPVLELPITGVQMIVRRLEITSE